MATAVVVPGDEVIVAAPITTESMWARISSRLSVWRDKFIAGAKRVGNWFVRALKWTRDKIVAGAKWVWNLPPVRWTVAQTRSFGGWLRHGIWRGPVPWVLGGGVVGAVMPPLFMVGAMTAVTVALVMLFWRTRRPVALPIETSETLLVTDNVDSDLQDRMEILNDLMDAAVAKGDVEEISAVTGKMAAVTVRAGGSRHPRNASEKVVYDYAMSEAKKREPTFAWKGTTMRNAVRSELARLKRMEKARLELVRN